MAIIALIASLTGTAFAALSKNSVGSRQLKSKAVTAAKFADGSVSGAKIADSSLTGSDVDKAALGTVPSAQTADGAQNSVTVGGHPASCPAGTTLIRGTCFDSNPSGPVTGVTTAADRCAASGGWLPNPELLESTRGILPLGDGNGTNSQFTDSYSGDTNGGDFRVIVVDSTGDLSVKDYDATSKTSVAVYEYTCAYPLVR